MKAHMALFVVLVFSFRHLRILLVGIPLVCANLWVFLQILE